MKRIVVSLLALTCICVTAMAQASLDCSKIVASRGTVATGGMQIVGRAGSVTGSGTVTITDSNGHSVTATVADDGSFRITEANLPEGFDHTLGGTLKVKAGNAECTIKITR